MKATYGEYLDQNPPCRKFSTDPDAQAVFALLSEDENIIKMLDASESRRPALTPVVSLIEQYFDTHKPVEFNFSLSFPRTVVGCMIKTILSPFGYLVLSPKTRAQKGLPKSVHAKYFASASCYEKKGKATMQIIRTVAEVK